MLKLLLAYCKKTYHRGHENPKCLSGKNKGAAHDNGTHVYCGIIQEFLFFKPSLC
jgi:hypothetical protein